MSVLPPFSAKASCIVPIHTGAASAASAAVAHTSTAATHASTAVATHTHTTATHTTTSAASAIAPLAATPLIPIVPVHGTRKSFFQGRARDIGGAGASHLELLEPLSTHPLQDVGMGRHTPRRTPDADAQTGIFGADCLMQGPQTIVTGVTATEFEPDNALGQVQLIVYDEDILDCEAIARGNPLNRPAAYVHEGLRFGEYDPLPLVTRLPHQSVRGHLPVADTQFRGKGVDNLEARVVAGICIFRSWITQANDEMWTEKRHAQDT
jgi:hypothetical protein